MTTETASEVTGLLQRAFEGTHVVFVNAHGRPNPIPFGDVAPHLMANDDWSARYRIEQVANEATPWRYGPAFSALQKWVERHLQEPTEVRPPADTVALYRGGNWRPNRITNPVVATRKLMLAAERAGADEIGRLVTEFLSHGLIQTEQFCLLKGFAIESRITLDDYCTLMPYRDMVHYLKRKHTNTLFDKWPEEDTNVCVLRATRFEDRFVDPPEEGGMVYGSPLLKHGPDHLARLLSVVWGYGFSCFMSEVRVPPSVNAALPYDGLLGGGGMVRQTELLAMGFGTRGQKRPLPASELSDLAAAYLRRSEQTQRVLDLALRWFRESLTRTEVEDTVMSQSIALETLFGEPGKHHDIGKRLRSRGSWYYADSLKERHKTRKLLEEFYQLRSRIVHGGAVANPDPSLMQEVSSVLRSSIKSMIANGRPQDWSGAKGSGSIRRDPPRSEDDIPSDKADSASCMDSTTVCSRVT
ncbi:HEPN domain-containing protein [Candidatus Palauibacter soopunensis]|uniref:HEPN domain-containing protein n=1 Tax=Candidatus Palauibacter soopunensis TaxID=3056739 RepID=UPI00238D9283|nr:HEPN domain-containing protein [Candidatus Palauibacter soopunensis]MDE2879542.1 HEPN domain-containing protein [Candidatus Palauibacter soopunensis]